MKREVLGIAAMCMLSLLLVGAQASAQGPLRRGRGGGGMYDTKTVETISGTVVRVETVQQRGRGYGRGGGVHLLVKTDKEETAVHLGPTWYVEKEGPKIKPQDKVEIKGSRITFQGKPAIIAAVVTKDGKTMRLRDDNGIPAWRGQGRRRR